MKLFRRKKKAFLFTLDKSLDRDYIENFEWALSKKVKILDRAVQSQEEEGLIIYRYVVQMPLFRDIDLKKTVQKTVIAPHIIEKTESKLPPVIDMTDGLSLSEIPDDRLIPFFQELTKIDHKYRIGLVDRLLSSDKKLSELVVRILSNTQSNQEK